MTRRVVKQLVDTGIIIIAHRLLHHNAPQPKSTIAMSKHHAKALAVNGVHRSTEEVVGVLIHAHLIHATRQMYGTARLKRSVKQLVDTGIIIIVLLVHLRSVPQRRNTTAMTRRVVKGLEEIGARRLEERQEVIAPMLLVQHARHRKHGIAMTKHRVKALEGIGVNHLVQQHLLHQLVGVQLQHAPHTHAINHPYGIVMSKHHAKALAGAGVYRNMGEVAIVRHQHAL
jgi:hypothetical protein